MITEMNQVKRFLGAKFGYGELINDGIFAVPTETSKGKAFMKMEFRNGETAGKDNFSLFWDEELTNSWYTEPKPEEFKESKFSKAFRNMEKCRI